MMDGIAINLQPVIAHSQQCRPRTLASFDAFLHGLRAALPPPAINDGCMSPCVRKYIEQCIATHMLRTAGAGGSIEDEGEEDDDEVDGIEVHEGGLAPQAIFPHNRQGVSAFEPELKDALFELADQRRSVLGLQDMALRRYIFTALRADSGGLEDGLVLARPESAQIYLTVAEDEDAIAARNSAGQLNSSIGIGAKMLDNDEGDLTPEEAALLIAAAEADGLPYDSIPESARSLGVLHACAKAKGLLRAFAEDLVQQYSLDGAATSLLLPPLLAAVVSTRPQPPFGDERLDEPGPSGVYLLKALYGAITDQSRFLALLASPSLESVCMRNRDAALKYVATMGVAKPPEVIAPLFGTTALNLVSVTKSFSPSTCLQHDSPSTDWSDSGYSLACEYVDARLVQGVNTNPAVENSIQSESAWLVALHSHIDEIQTTKDGAAKDVAWRPPLKKGKKSRKHESDKVADWLLTGRPLAGASSYNTVDMGGTEGLDRGEGTVADASQRPVLALRRQLVAHLAIVSSTATESHRILHWFKQVLFEPWVYQNDYLPGQPLSEKQQIMHALGSVGWYTCPRGHPYSVGNCTYPMELSTCATCGAQIGGQDHNTVQGTTRLGRNAAIRDPGYILSEPPARVARRVRHEAVLGADAPFMSGGGGGSADKTLEIWLKDIPTCYASSVMVGGIVEHSTTTPPYLSTRLLPNLTTHPHLLDRAGYGGVAPSLSYAPPRWHDNFPRLAPGKDDS
jgi:hypothetical protein